MKRRAAVPVVVIALLSLVYSAVAAVPPVTAWKNGLWFDGTSFKRVDVYSTGERLTLKPPKTVDRTVDLSGRYVIPPLGEAHNHNIPGIDTTGNIRTYLQQGIYYVMIQGNVPEAPKTLAAQLNVPTSVDVAFSNGLFTSPGGHPSGLVERNIKNGGMTPDDRDGGFLHPVPSTGDIDRVWWTRIKQQRPDFIKMVLVYSEDRVAGVPRPDSDRHGLDPFLAAHLVKLAHRDKLRVSAHVESAYDFEVAVKAGADIIAHLPGFWPDPPRIASKGLGIYRISEDAARRAGRQNVTVITTISESLRYVANDPAGASFREPILDLYRHNLSVLSKSGVRIAIGSDQFRSTSLAEALEIHKAGLMTPAALLRALSSDAAATIFPKRAPFGLAEGAPADFLALDADPLADFTAIQRIGLRVKGGREL